ncbi:MAG TPA: energy transducer TonB [Gammaproteobacteria bacterium]|nr:energy transducer TonB [Gammaproteobacteria bacterium]
MSRQKTWHLSLLPALFFSLLLHMALLPLWRQSSSIGTPALPSLQITLRTTPNIQTQDRIAQRQPQPTRPHSVSPVTANDNKASDHNPNTHKSTHQPATSKPVPLAVDETLQEAEIPAHNRRIAAHKKSITSPPFNSHKEIPRTTAPKVGNAPKSMVTAAPTNQPTNTPAMATNPASKSQILTWLNREIRKYFYYPGMARRRNLEGTVILRFAVQQNGHITDARIAQSSGTGILDRAALNSLHKLGIVTLPLGENLELSLPVIYRLNQRG